MNETMNINAQNGQAVIFAYPKAGYDPDMALAAQHLRPGMAYRVQRCIVHRSSTDVELQEFPDILFNSVHFRDAK